MKEVQETFYLQKQSGPTAFMLAKNIGSTKEKKSDITAVWRVYLNYTGQRINEIPIAKP